jgi:polyhydroxyalkanoate synthesis regulator phasin
MVFGDLMKKAVYLGVGLAAYAGEKAGKTIEELREQGQKLAQEMVERGEITADEARRYVDEWISKTQQAPASPPTPSQTTPQQPRQIEILEEDSASQPDETVDDMQKKLADLQAELNRLRNNR